KHGEHGSGNLVCSFCGKSQDEVRKLIAGPTVYICDECIDLCNDIIAEECDHDENLTASSNVPKPAEIKRVLDQYVIGQERAKKILAVAVHNHYKRIDSQMVTGDVELQKSNILLLGPTGSGKTLLAQTLARFLQVPFTIADATSLTEAGYVGEDVENIIRKRTGRKRLGFGGQIEERDGRRPTELLHDVQPEDLLKFGLIPEFIGRLPVIATLDELDESALMRILKEPKNALTKQYSKLFEMETVHLKFTEEALRAIAREAMKRKSGARGLRAIMENIMLDIMYDMPSQPNIKEVVISDDVVDRNEAPIVVYTKAAESA